MKRLLLVLAVAAAALAVAVPASFAKEATTAPGYNFFITVKISANDTVLSRSVARRGWRAHFVIQNRDKVAHRFEIGGLKTPLIQPGKRGRLGAQLETRGAYSYHVDGKLRGYFRVI